MTTYISQTQGYIMIFSKVSNTRMHAKAVGLPNCKLLKYDGRCEAKSIVQNDTRKLINLLHQN